MNGLPILKKSRCAPCILGRFAKGKTGIMIHPNELRIGSLFYPIGRSGEVHLPQEIPHRVLTLQMFGLEGVQPHENPAIFDKVPRFRYEDISPIPLAPEILERCGFKYDHKYDEGTMRLDDEFTLVDRGDGSYLPFPYKAYGGFAKEVSCLHQLQNLHFALTGKEITIQPFVPKSSPLQPSGFAEAFAHFFNVELKRIEQ
jgi:hypothetical protein